LRGLTRTYINRLVRNGYDTPEAIAEVPLQELEKFLPKNLSARLRRYCENPEGPKESAPREAPPIMTGRAEALSEPAPGDDRQSLPLSDPAPTENLDELLAEQPIILLDESQHLFFYRGVPVVLPPAEFKLIALLAKRPGEVVSRKEIYARLWPESDSFGPYEHQISDHKIRILRQIKKALVGKTGVDPTSIKGLIKTVRKVGYKLDLKREDIRILQREPLG
jgi:DNA-binding response OmpR family regulator